MKTSFPYGSFLKRSYFLWLSFRDLQILFPKILFELKFQWSVQITWLEPSCWNNNFSVRTAESDMTTYSFPRGILEKTKLDN